MARTPADPTQRIARLTEARKLVTPRELLNGEEMAAAAGISWRHMKPMVDADPEWPIVQRGSEGVAWQFEGRRVIDHMIRRDRETLATREKQRSRLAKLAGVEVEKGSAYSLSELREIDRLQQSAHRRKIEQGDYVRRDLHETLVADLLTIVQTEALAVRSKLDPAGQWPVEIGAGVDETMRDMLVRVHDRSGELIPRDARQ